MTRRAAFTRVIVRGMFWLAVACILELLLGLQ